MPDSGDTDTFSDKMRRVHSQCQQLDAARNKLMGLAFAHERGWLDPDDQREKEQLDREVHALAAELEQRWAALTRAEPERVRDHCAALANTIRTLAHDTPSVPIPEAYAAVLDDLQRALTQMSTGEPMLHDRWWALATATALLEECGTPVPDVGSIASPLKD